MGIFIIATKKMKNVLMITIIVFVYGCTNSQNSPTVGPWIAPASVNTEINPFKGDSTATGEGKKLFIQACAVCHGEKGKGDGIGGIALIPKPGNFTLEKTQSQTDGALFWKLSEGRAPMASYKTLLTSNQRWQLVNFIRTLKN